MTKIVVLGTLMMLCACARYRAVRVVALEERGDAVHPLYVGHSDNGDVVVAATHYDAMQGVAVTAEELGGKGGEQMFCAREMLTGTHVPKWICRPQSELDAERLRTQDWLDAPRVNLGRGPALSTQSALQAPPAH